MRRASKWAIAGGLLLLLFTLRLLATMRGDAAPPSRREPIRDRGAIVRGPRELKRLALVFTADEFCEGGPVILDALRARRARATFFLTGRFLRRPGSQVVLTRLRVEGHMVGPHSDAHLLYASWEAPPRLLVSRAEFEADLAANLRALEQAGFPPNVGYFLPPYEHYTEEIALWTAEGGRSLINMTTGTRSHVDYMTDDDLHFVSADAIVASVLRAERSDRDGLNGYLLLMHLGAGPRRTRDHLHDRLGELLDELTRRGYGFVRVDELLGSRAPGKSVDAPRTPSDSAAVPPHAPRSFDPPR